MPYGNRYYHPIWEACERHGLVVGVHPGNEGAGMAGAPTGVGYPTYYIETRMARPQMAMAHAVSFIAEGVFEKFPRLKVLFDECDQFWAVGLMWHMDADWKACATRPPGSSACRASTEKLDRFAIFTKHRRRFEDFIIKYKDFPNQVVVNSGSGLKGYVKLEQLFSEILNQIEDGKDEAGILKGLSADTRFEFLRVTPPTLATMRKGFSTDVKSAVFLKDAWTLRSDAEYAIAMSIRTRCTLTTLNLNGTAEQVL